jgi:hypothetical protein
MSFYIRNTEPLDLRLAKQKNNIVNNNVKVDLENKEKIVNNNVKVDLENKEKIVNNITKIQAKVEEIPVFDVYNNLTQNTNLKKMSSKSVLTFNKQTNSWKYNDDDQ